MPKALDLTGERFGELVVISKAPSKSGKTYWNCQCDCGKKSTVQTGHLKSGAIKTCGHTQKQREILYCLFCGSVLPPTAKKYCGSDCKTEYEYDQYIKRWKAGLETGMKGKGGISVRIRKYLFRKYSNKCCKCHWGEINPYTNKIPLEVHHIDGDYKNNIENNLELLCPNCHSLTESFKGSNVGNGRQDRYK